MDPHATICCSIYLYLNLYNHQWSLSTDKNHKWSSLWTILIMHSYKTTYFCLICTFIFWYAAWECDKEDGFQPTSLIRPVGQAKVWQHTQRSLTSLTFALRRVMADIKLFTWLFLKKIANFKLSEWHMDIKKITGLWSYSCIFKAF